MLKEEIVKIKNNFEEELKKVKNVEMLFELEKKYLGRKSKFSDLLKNLRNISSEKRKTVGELANNTKKELLKKIQTKKQEIITTNFDWEREKIDITIPGKQQGVGHLNPISLVRSEIEDIFLRMGYEISDGPEIETEFYNFDALNIPQDHPARDMQDTFWLKEHIQKGDKKERLSMRSQTSAMQARYMQKHKPPFRIIAPGKCFRNEATDTTHEHTFYQFEALVVGDDINVGHLKFVAETFFSEFFAQKVKIRLRPSYFPFTEPGFEFDISCLVCGGKGCRACQGNGWLELGGAGMVNQNVFVSAGYPRNRYTGFAWGFGFERLAMMKYKIDDVRLFHGGDLRFIKQF